MWKRVQLTIHNEYTQDQTPQQIASKRFKGDENQTKKRKTQDIHKFHKVVFDESKTVGRNIEQLDKFSLCIKKSEIPFRKRNQLQSVW